MLQLIFDFRNFDKIHIYTNKKHAEFKILLAPRQHMLYEKKTHSHTHTHNASHRLGLENKSKKNEAKQHNKT